MFDVFMSVLSEAYSSITSASFTGRKKSISYQLTCLQYWIWADCWNPMCLLSFSKKCYRRPLHQLSITALIAKRGIFIHPCHIFSKYSIFGHPNSNYASIWPHVQCTQKSKSSQKIRLLQMFRFLFYICLADRIHTERYDMVSLPINDERATHIE